MTLKTWRFVGFDDGFRSLRERRAHLVGCVTAGCRVEGFLYSTVEVDGLDVTDRICDLVTSSKFGRQIACIFLYNITFAGMNVADIRLISEKTGKAVISVTKKRSSIENLIVPARKAGEGADVEKRLEILIKAGYPCLVNGVYVHISGCSVEDAKKFLKASTCVGKIPECLRVAHLVASALAYGESKKA